MGDDGTVLNAKYDALYAEPSAVQGIKSIIAAGDYRINGSVFRQLLKFLTKKSRKIVFTANTPD